jgi:hypothetical protein
MAGRGKAQGTDWKGFANVPFNAEARMLYEADTTTENVTYQRLEELISGGYRVTFAYDKNNDAYQCSLTCGNPKDPNNGYTLTARGPSWWDALRVATFKHFTLCSLLWPHGEKTTGDKWG